MTAEFEHLLQLSGGFGRYQWFLYAFYMAVVFVVAPQNAFMIFGKLEPADEELCHFRNRSWYNGSALANETGCNEDIRFYSVTMEFDLLGPRIWIQGLMISIQYAAMMISALVMGQLSDRFGRKPSFVGCFIILVCISIAGSFSPNWQTFVGIRFFIGGFLAAVFGPLGVLCLESVPQNWRLFLNMGGWAAGYSFLAFLGYFIRDWRYLLIATNITAPIALLLVYWIHESPKWLMEKSRFKEAVQVFKRIGEWNNVTNWDDDVFLQVDQQLKAIQQARQDLKEKQSLLTYWHLFYDCRAARILVTIIITRSITVGLYYGLLFNTGKLSGDVSLNLFLTMLIRGCIDLFPFLIDHKFPKIGRRHLLIFGMSVAWLCMGYSMIAYATNWWRTIPISLNITAYIGIGFVMIANNVVHELCLIETTPTLLRSMGDSLVTCLSRFGAIIGPQIILLYEIWKAGPSLIFLIELTVAILLVYFILPETKGKPLPDLPPKFTRNLAMKSLNTLNVEEKQLTS